VSVTWLELIVKVIQRPTETVHNAITKPPTALSHLVVGPNFVPIVIHDISTTLLRNFRVQRTLATAHHLNKIVHKGRNCRVRFSRRGKFD
jgi:hypothetical protein